MGELLLALGSGIAGKRQTLDEELLDSYDSAERNDGNDHDRMPVLLDPSNYDLWLDPGMTKSASGIRKSTRSAQLRHCRFLVLFTLFERHRVTAALI